MSEVLAKSQMREAILSLEDDISWTDGALMGDNKLCPLYHYFTDGIYVREIRIPAGVLLTGKIHKHEHPSFLLEGIVECATEEKGIETISAPMLMISSAGTKRAIRTITDTIWVTVHHNPTNTKDLGELEQEVIAPSYEAFDQYIAASKEMKQLPQITNCGLIALRQLTDMKNVSMRSLISIAEDNGIKLYPYRQMPGVHSYIVLPAIYHANNHFIYVEKESDLEGYDLTGNFLLTEESSFLLPIPKEELAFITGATWVAAVVAGVGTGFGIYSDLHAKNQAKKDQKRLMAEQQAYQTPDGFQQNKDLASYMSQYGLDEQSLQFYKSQNERNLANANQTALELGGGINTINQNYESSIRGLGDLALKNSMMKADNLKLLMEQTSAMAGQDQMNWAINYKAWKDKMNLANNQINASNQSLANNVSNLGSILANSLSTYKSGQIGQPPIQNNPNQTQLQNLGLDR